VNPVRRAVIDVGTNSVKLLVVEIRGREAVPLWEESKQTRLGRGFYPHHILQPEPIAQTANAIVEFRAKAIEFGVNEPRLVATSAVREARNQGELRATVEQVCGLPLRVISGEQEATYAFDGAISDPRFAQAPVLLLDVGGGSTEFIVGHCGVKSYARSFPLGTVRLLELLRPADPPTPDQLAECRAWVRGFLESEIWPKLAPTLDGAPEGAAIAKGRHLVGTGGTASILGCMEAKLTRFDRERLEATRLTAPRIRWHVEHLWGMPASERRAVVGLPSNRADVILTGTAIYESILELFGFEELHVSTRGLRFAVALE
jgi:exopolyphosphatase / guanosine-5'-triphosphate,3'-diphosphate pyrophosphatase